MARRRRKKLKRTPIPQASEPHGASAYRYRGGYRGVPPAYARHQDHDETTDAQLILLDKIFATLYFPPMRNLSVPMTLKALSKMDPRLAALSSQSESLFLLVLFLALVRSRELAIAVATWPPCGIVSAAAREYWLAIVEATCFSSTPTLDLDDNFANVVFADPEAAGQHDRLAVSIGRGLVAHYWAVHFAGATTEEHEGLRHALIVSKNHLVCEAPSTPGHFYVGAQLFYSLLHVVFSDASVPDLHELLLGAIASLPDDFALGDITINRFLSKMAAEKARWRTPFRRGIPIWTMTDAAEAKKSPRRLQLEAEFGGVKDQLVNMAREDTATLASLKELEKQCVHTSRVLKEVKQAVRQRQ